MLDGSPTAGNVPGRISFVTGSNITNRLERLTINSNGNFIFNSGQLFIRKSDGRVGVGITAPLAKLHITGDEIGIYTTGKSYGIHAKATDDENNGS